MVIEMIDEELRNQILENHSFEWSQESYYSDESTSKLLGHALKHLKKEYQLFNKLFQYDYHNIDEEAVRKYEQLSIDNINQNKYIKERIYFNEKNKSVNIVGDNHLETCLKRNISKNNQLVIVSCFFRNKLYDLYDDKKFSMLDVGSVMKYFNTLNNDRRENVDFEAALNDFIIALKDGQSDSIKGMIDQYFGNTYNYDKDELDDEIHKLLDSIHLMISNIIAFGKDHSFEFEDIKREEYDFLSITDGSEEVFSMTDEDIIKGMDEIDKKDEFVSLLDIYDIYDTIHDLLMIYIYASLFHNTDMLEDYCRNMHYIEQLSTSQNELYNIIVRSEVLLNYNGRVGDTYYSPGHILEHYQTRLEYLKSNFDLLSIKGKILELEKHYPNSLISCSYCYNCHKELYFISEYPFTDIYYHDQLVENKGICPECGSSDIKDIISNAEVMFDEI